MKIPNPTRRSKRHTLEFAGRTRILEKQKTVEKMQSTRSLFGSDPISWINFTGVRQHEVRVRAFQKKPMFEKPRSTAAHSKLQTRLAEALCHLCSHGLSNPLLTVVHCSSQPVITNLQRLGLKLLELLLGEVEIASKSMLPQDLGTQIAQIPGLANAEAVSRIH